MYKVRFAGGRVAAEVQLMDSFSPRKYLKYTSTDIQYWHKELHILFCSITPTNLGQFSKPGTDLKCAGPDVLKTPPTCPFSNLT